MSKAEYWQRGEAIDFTNDTGSAIEANEIVVFGSHIGVAGAPIAKGETGSLHVASVFEMPKSSENEIKAGTTVYYDGTGITEASKTGSSTDNTAAGYATETAAASATTIKVKLLG